MLEKKHPLYQKFWDRPVLFWILWDKNGSIFQLHWKLEVLGFSFSLHDGEEELRILLVEWRTSLSKLGHKLRRKQWGLQKVLSYNYNTKLSSSLQLVSPNILMILARLGWLILWSFHQQLSSLCPLLHTSKGHSSLLCHFLQIKVKHPFRKEMFGIFKWNKGKPSYKKKR